MTISNSVDTRTLDLSRVQRSTNSPFECVGSRTVVGIMAVCDEYKGRDHIFELSNPGQTVDRIKAFCQRNLEID